MDLEEPRDLPPVVPAAHRMERTMAAIRNHAHKLTEPEYMELMDTLGWFDAVSYTEAGKLSTAGLNDLQRVALAAAMLAYLEVKGRATN